MAWNWTVWSKGCRIPGAALLGMAWIFTWLPKVLLYTTLLASSTSILPNIVVPCGGVASEARLLRLLGKRSVPSAVAGAVVVCGITKGVGFGRENAVDRDLVKALICRPQRDHLRWS